MLGLAGLIGSGPGAAAQLTVEIESAEGPVAQVLVQLSAEPPIALPAAGIAVMDQVGSEFVPRVMAVVRGTRVEFPNSDLTRNQVYSFSPAKRFELPLYEGRPPAPIEFDTPGVITLGCNIHDWMVGYIVVTDTPYFALSDAKGQVEIEAPAGRYRLSLWHERQAAGTVDDWPDWVDVPGELKVSIPLRPPPPPRGDARMRALQEKFRRLKREPVDD